MKAIQVSFDEGLLARLDEDQSVKREGRSAVLRKAALQYLESRRLEQIAQQYQRAYGEEASGLGEEFEGWEDQGEWSLE